MKLGLALERCGRSRCWCLPAQGPAPGPAVLSWAKPTGTVGWHWRAMGTLGESQGLEVDRSQSNRTNTWWLFPRWPPLHGACAWLLAVLPVIISMENGQKPPVLWQVGSVVPNIRESPLLQIFPLQPQYSNKDML